jgi:hypothetical protein
MLHLKTRDPLLRVHAIVRRPFECRPAKSARPATEANRNDEGSGTAVEPILTVIESAFDPLPQE